MTRPRCTTDTRADTGAATVLVLTVATVLLAAGLLAAVAASLLGAGARARTAADLAALAGADALGTGRDPCAAARTVAAANSARLVACTAVPGDVTVVAEVTAPTLGTAVLARARAAPGTYAQLGTPGTRHSR